MAGKNYKKKYKKAKNQNKTLNSRVATLEKNQKKMIEMKQYDVTSFGTFTTGSSALIALTTVPRGDTDEERIGNNINIRSLGFRIEINSSLQLAFSQCRLMLVVCKKDPIAINQIVDSFATNVLGYRNAPYAKDYRVLYDKIIVMNNSPYYDTSGTPSLKYTNKRVYKDYYKELNLEATYHGALGLDQVNNHIYAILVTADAQSLSYSMESRIRYLDA